MAAQTILSAAGSLCAARSGKDKDLPASQASIANMGVMLMLVGMTNAGRVPLANPNSIWGEGRWGTFCLKYFWLQCCCLWAFLAITLFPCSLSTSTMRVSSSLPLPALDSVIILHSLPGFFFSEKAWGNPRRPWSRGESVCNQAVAAPAKQALPYDKVYVSWPTSSCFSQSFINNCCMTALLWPSIQILVFLASLVHRVNSSV